MAAEDTASEEIKGNLAALSIVPGGDFGLSEPESEGEGGPFGFTFIGSEVAECFLEDIAELE
jgi:hypothetical protein